MRLDRNHLSRVIRMAQDFCEEHGDEADRVAISHVDTWACVTSKNRKRPARLTDKQREIVDAMRGGKKLLCGPFGPYLVMPDAPTVVSSNVHISVFRGMKHRGLLVKAPTDHRAITEWKLAP